MHLAAPQKLPDPHIELEKDETSLKLLAYTVLVKSDLLQTPKPHWNVEKHPR